MRVNEHTKLIGHRVVLVPYRKCHVVKYHTWMEDEELRNLTASERLSLEEEYDMQAKWHEDDDKCTFIILARDLMDTGVDEIASMVGDVNIFINGSVGELTTMIAESKWRRKGLGEEAARIMLRFAAEVIGLRAFEVKVSKDNVSSLKLFQKIGFVITSECNKFHEYTLSAGVESIVQTTTNLAVTVDNYLTIQDSWKFARTWDWSNHKCCLALEIIINDEARKNTKSFQRLWLGFIELLEYDLDDNPAPCNVRLVFDYVLLL